ncbi:MAG: trigger factor [Lachnospiraceae bacterium]|nr:trigger factor [Lachnospiraceae bacterium]
MKKKTTLLTAILLAVMVLATGCGNNTAENAEQTTAAEAGGKNEALDSVDASKLVQLGDYKGLSISVNATAVTEEALEDAIKDALMSEATLVDAGDGPVKDGDTVNIDYEGKKDGVAFDGGTAQGYNLVIGSGSFIDGFEDGLIGAKKGETKDLNLTFPADYHSADLAGADVVFTVKVNSISENEVPELTDEIAQKLNPDTKTAEEYKKYLEETMKEANEDVARNDAYSNLLSQVAQSSSVVSGNDIPSGLIDAIVESEKATFEATLQMYGTDINGYLTSQGITEADYDAQVREYAHAVAKQELLIRALAQAEGIEVTQADVDQQYEDMYKEYGYDSAESFKSAVAEQKGEDTFRDAVLTRKVEEMLFKYANITNPENMDWD